MVHWPAHPRCARQHQGTGKLPRAGISPPTVSEWLEEWLAAKKNIRAGTVRGYESHIRLYLAPSIGHVPLARLRVSDVAAVFEYIDDLNDAVTAARASGDPELRAAGRLVGRRPASGSAPPCAPRSAPT